MTISDSTQRAQDLLQQLASYQEVAEHDELKALVTLLGQELAKLESQISDSTTTQASPEQPPKPQIDEKTGCYKFENEQGFFCPNCYDQNNSSVPTKRLNRLLRVCPNCRASIKPI
jgi:hypothetical protein